MLRHKGILLILIFIFVFASCSHKDEDIAFSAPGVGSSALDRENSPRITLTVSPVSLGYTSEDVREMIATLRIIMVSESENENGETSSFVELNEFIDFLKGNMFEGNGELANTFRFVFTRHTFHGVKKLYLVANEASVGNVNFQTDNLPEWLSAAGEVDLTTFLNHYEPDYIPGFSEGEIEMTPVANGAEFEAMVNSLYYTPSFVQIPEGEPNQGPVAGSQSETGGNSIKEIYLPYSSFYTYTLVSEAEMESGDAPDNAFVNVVDEAIHLVPAANKFRFQFRNFRTQPVTIPTLKLSGIATDMYLFAQVNEADRYKGAAKDTWWINWMASVASMSYSYPEKSENEAFNNSYGWIDSFRVPDSAYPVELQEDINGEMREGVYELVPEGQPWYVERRDPSTSPIDGPPGEASTGFFYLPESRNLVQQQLYDENGEPVGDPIWVQRYFLTITMASGQDGNLTSTRDTQIGNLGSMFRDTNVMITITMRDANDVGAYAQIQSWDNSHTNGTVMEDQNPEEE